MTSQNTLCRHVSCTLRLGDELGRCGGIVSGRAEGSRSSVFDVVSVQWIVSEVCSGGVACITFRSGCSRVAVSLTSDENKCRYSVRLLCLSSLCSN